MKRRSAAIVAAVLLAAACSGNASEPIDQGETAAAVAHVFDGDSMRVLINGEEAEVRLLGINAPEGDECFGEQAREALIGLTDGNDVMLIADANADTDRYGRLLRYVDAGGVLVNHQLIEDGHAVALQGEHERNAEFVDAAAVAVEARIGMWAPDACGPPPPEGIEITAVDYNPPGPDDERLNDESVTIENTGSESIDLTGWTLRDESSQNRYFLDRVELWPGRRAVVHTGCGSDESSPRLQVLHWCADAPVWSNGGDTAILQDRHGNVIDWWMYSE